MRRMLTQKGHLRPYTSRTGKSQLFLPCTHPRPIHPFTKVRKPNRQFSIDFLTSDLQAFLGDFVQAKLALYGPKNALKGTCHPYAKSVAKRRALDDSQVTYTHSTEKRKKSNGDDEPPLKLTCLPGVEAVSYTHQTLPTKSIE